MKTLEQILELTSLKDTGCMEWTRCLNTDGYPRMGVKGNSNIKVHRLVYELHTGEDIEGKVVRHTCDNPKCINPDHLVIGTNTENVADRVERGRSRGHVTEEEVRLVYSLRVQGFIMKDIANALGIKFKRVEYILNNFKNPLGSGG